MCTYFSDLDTIKCSAEEEILRSYKLYDQRDIKYYLKLIEPRYVRFIHDFFYSTVTPFGFHYVMICQIICQKTYRAQIC